MFTVSDHTCSATLGGGHSTGRGNTGIVLIKSVPVWTGCFL